MNRIRLLLSFLLVGLALGAARGQSSPPAVSGASGGSASDGSASGSSASGSSASGSSASGSSASGSSTSGSSASGSSASGSSASGSPVSGSPVSGSPVSGSPVSGSPVSGASASGSSSADATDRSAADQPAGELTPQELRRLITAATPQAPAAGSIRFVGSPFPGGGIDGYSVYLPRTYDARPETSFPILMFLQGGLAVGGDPAIVHNWGLPRMLWEEARLDSERHRLVLDEFVIVTPHLGEDDQFWAQEQAIEQILDEVLAAHRTDAARVYLTGLSRGGHGTWGLASRLAWRFAAVAPIGGDIVGIDDFRPLVDMPIWIAHNARDGVVPAWNAVDAVALIEARGGEPFHVFDTFDVSDSDCLDQLHVFVTPDLETHDAWTPTYAHPGFFRWLLSHRDANAAVTQITPTKFY